MTDTTTSTVATAGTPEGLKGEIRSQLPPSEERACNKALYKGSEVMSKNMHPRRGLFQEESAFMRPSWHPDVLEAGQDMTDELYSLQSDKWRTRMGQGRIKIVPNLGEAQIDHEKSIMQLIKWNGFIYDSHDRVHDMREKSALETRAFFRRHVLPRWQVDPQQTSLQPYDEVETARVLAMGEMLSNMGTLLDETIGNFLAFHEWILKHGESALVFAVGFGTSQGLRVTEADE